MTACVGVPTPLLPDEVTFGTPGVLDEGKGSRMTTVEETKRLLPALAPPAGWLHRDARSKDTSVPDPDLTRAAGWRQVVFARVRRLEAAVLEVADPDTFPYDQFARQLAVASASAQGKEGAWAWWYGTLLERSWLALHDAEVLVVQHMPPEQAAVWWRAATDVEDSQQIPAGASGGRKLSKSSSYAIAQSLRRYYDRSDRRFEEARGFRNRLIRLTAIGACISVLLLLVGACNWLEVATPDGEKVVVRGTQDFLLVQLFGAVGAFITSLPALSRAPARRTPFRLPLHQLTLKLAVGPVFALLGVLAIQGGFVGVAKPFDSFGAPLLLWATVLGGGQQAVTGLFDRKAESIAQGSPKVAA